MADGEEGNDFWCYQCQRAVQRGGSESSDAARCSICDSGFVEELQTVDRQSLRSRNRVRPVRSRGRERDIEADLGRLTVSLRASFPSLETEDLDRFLPLVREIARGATAPGQEITSQRGSELQGESSLSAESSERVAQSETIGAELVEAARIESHIGGQEELPEGTSTLQEDTTNQGGQELNAQVVPLLEELEEHLEMLHQEFDVNDWQSMSEGEEGDEEEDDEWEEWVEGEHDEEGEGDGNNVGEGEQAEGIGEVAADAFDVAVEAEAEAGNEGQDSVRRHRHRIRQARILRGAQGQETGTDFAATLQELLQNLESRADQIREIFMAGGGMYVGNPGDYLDAEGLDTFVQQMAANDNSRRGPPPASKAAVDSLAVLCVDKATCSRGLSLCAICKDTADVGEVMLSMPCSHNYHAECIKQWLASRNSCPVCRYELPTDDTDYEEQRKARGHLAEASAPSSEPSDNLVTDTVDRQDERRNDPVVENEVEPGQEQQENSSEDASSFNRNINVLAVSDVVLEQEQGGRLQQSGEHLSRPDMSENPEDRGHSISQDSSHSEAIVRVRPFSLFDFAARVLQFGGFLVALYFGRRGFGRVGGTENERRRQLEERDPRSEDRSNARSVD